MSIQTIEGAACARNGLCEQSRDLIEIAVRKPIEARVSHLEDYLTYIRRYAEDISRTTCAGSTEGNVETIKDAVGGLYLVAQLLETALVGDDADDGLTAKGLALWREANKHGAAKVGDPVIAFI